MGFSSAFDKAAKLAANAKQATLKAGKEALNTTSRNLNNLQQNVQSKKAEHDLQSARLKETFESKSNNELKFICQTSKYSWSERKLAHDIYKQRTGQSLLLNDAKEFGNKAKDSCMQVKDRCQNAVKDLWEKHKPR